MGIGIGLTIIVEKHEDMLRVGETLNRTAVGLAMEGFTASMNYTTFDDENGNEGNDPLGGHADPRYEL